MDEILNFELQERERLLSKLKGGEETEWFSFGTVTKSNSESSFEAVFSTSDVDRMGDVVVQEGLDLKNWKRNPVILWQHQHDKPIGVASRIRVEDNKRLVGTVSLDMDDPLAVQVAGKLSKGHLRGFSIGFKPLTWEEVKNPDAPFGFGIKFLTAEILESSVVSIPANPHALRRAFGESIGIVEPEGKELPLAKIQQAIRKVHEDFAKEPAYVGTLMDAKTLCALYQMDFSRRLEVEMADREEKIIVPVSRTKVAEKIVGKLSKIQSKLGLEAGERYVNLLTQGIQAGKDKDLETCKSLNVKLAEIIQQLHKRRND